MAVEVKLPEIGEGVESGDVLEVYVSEGDTIEKDQDILELETDKATLGVPSTEAGKVVKVHVKKGESISVGQTLITLEAGGGSSKPEESAEAEEESPQEEAAEEVQEEEEEPAEEESAEEEREEPAKAQEKQEAKAPEKTKEPEKKRSAEPEPKKTAQREPAPSAADHYDDDDAAVAAGPAVRRFAREVGVDLRGVKGTGEHGRITRDDVLNVVRSASKGTSGTSPKAGGGSKSSSAAIEKLAPPADGEKDKWGPVRYEKMSRIRKTIAAKMHESWTTCPRVTNFDDADITSLEKIRQASKADYAAAGIKLTAMPFLIKAVAMALRANPVLNASLDLENEQIVYKDYVNIGIAVDSERGLVVPSLRGAGSKSISEIARDLADLADSVRDSTFKIEDLQGSTFTISNLGAIGGTYSTPIINVPEVAILLVGRSRKMPVVVEDTVEVRLMMPLSLSYDHRLVDGATAARFLNEVIACLEEPSRLLLAP